MLRLGDDRTVRAAAKCPHATIRQKRGDLPLREYPLRNMRLDPAYLDSLYVDWPGEMKLPDAVATLRMGESTLRTRVAEGRIRRTPTKRFLRQDLDAYLHGGKLRIGRPKKGLAICLTLTRLDQECEQLTDMIMNGKEIFQTIYPVETRKDQAGWGRTHGRGQRMKARKGKPGRKSCATTANGWGLPRWRR